MNTGDPIPKSQSGSQGTAPKWLRELLHATESAHLDDFSKAIEWDVRHNIASKDFLQCCEEGATAAWTITLLAKQRERIGFLPLSLGVYMARLAKSAEVNIAPLLRFLGIEDINKIDQQQSPILARLGLILGMKLHHLLLPVKLGLLRHFPGFPVASLDRQRRSTAPRREPVEQCEALLAELESILDMDSRRHIASVEREIRNSYAAIAEGRDR